MLDVILYWRLSRRLIRVKVFVDEVCLARIIRHFPLLELGFGLVAEKLRHQGCLKIKFSYRSEQDVEQKVQGVYNSTDIAYHV